MNNQIPLDYIAILSYQICTKKISLYKQDITNSIAKSILINGFGVCAGSIAAPLTYAFQFAKQQGGVTRLITEQCVSPRDRHYCDILELVQNQIQKHELISSVCIGGIMISDAIGVHHLADCFIAKEKPVIAIEQFIETASLSPEIIVESEFSRAIEHLLHLELTN